MLIEGHLFVGQLLISSGILKHCSLELVAVGLHSQQGRAALLGENRPAKPCLCSDG